MKLSLRSSILLLILSLCGCAAYSPLPSKSGRPAAKAPILDRSYRVGERPPPRDTLEVGQLEPEDPLLPREQAYTDPRASNYPVERYAPPTYPDERYQQVAPANRPAADFDADYPAARGTANPPRSPVGAAYPQPLAPNIPADQEAAAPRTRTSEVEQGTFVIDRPAPRSRPVVDTPAVDTPPDPSPVRPAEMPDTLAMRQPAPPAAELPPAEITREGNQAVTALLDSAAQYVKAGQLDKAGASLERALRIEPRNASIWHDLAQIRLHQGQYQQAESLASKSNNLAAGNNALQSRNWKLIAAARKAGGNAAGAQQAEAQAQQF